MNIPYLVKILGTNKLSDVVGNLDLPFLDINLLLDDAVQDGQIEIDKKKDKIKALVEPEVTFDSDLANKLLRTMQHYWASETNISRGRLTSLVKNAGSQFNYPYHEYLMALQYLIDSGQVEEEVVVIEKDKKSKRPRHTYVFFQSPENPNEEWNRRVVNKWIENWNKKK